MQGRFVRVFGGQVTALDRAAFRWDEEGHAA
jgi:hypothetical protein